MDASNTATMERRAEEEMLLCETRPETAAEVLMQRERGRRQYTKSRAQRGGRGVARQGHSKKGWSTFCFVFFHCEKQKRGSPWGNHQHVGHGDVPWLCP